MVLKCGLWHCPQRENRRFFFRVCMWARELRNLEPMGSLFTDFCMQSERARAGSVMPKRRRRAAWLVMRVATAFFRLARNPVEAIADDKVWRDWEVNCFRLLHGPDFTAGVDEGGTPFVSVLPGVDLSRHLAAGTLLPAHLTAAGEELRRAHGFHSPHHGGGWSHGDSHTGNFLFDAATGRARLVDFEMRHHRDLPEPRRHADDLLVMLQDVCGRCGAGEWLPLAEAFLAGYGRREIITLLDDLMKVPRGVPRVWWAVRTSWMLRGELERRVAALRASLFHGCNKQGRGVLLPA